MYMKTINGGNHYLPQRKSTSVSVCAYNDPFVRLWASPKNSNKRDKIWKRCEGILNLKCCILYAFVLSF